MRDLKFRTWNPDTKRMNRLTSYNLYKSSIIPIYENHDVMQFTGLTDRNGVEIYEGDIYTVYSEMNSENVGTHIVEWGHSGFVMPNEEYITVLGNIYEHPHLLKENTNDQE